MKRKQRKIIDELVEAMREDQELMDLICERILERIPYQNNTIPLTYNNDPEQLQREKPWLFN